MGGLSDDIRLRHRESIQHAILGWVELLLLQVDMDIVWSNGSDVLALPDNRRVFPLSLAKVLFENLPIGVSSALAFNELEWSRCLWR